MRDEVLGHDRVDPENKSLLPVLVTGGDDERVAELRGLGRQGEGVVYNPL